MRYLDQYRHLNKASLFTVKLSLDEVAEKILAMNYGVHRLLSAIIRLRLEYDSNDELALGILALLEQGLY